MTLSANSDLSRRIARKVRARPGHCYHNAYKALEHLPGAIYVEGYVVTDRMLVIEHGWLEHEGSIVDPTLVDIAPEAHYEPGLRFTAAELYHALHTIPKSGKDDLPVFYRFGWGGMDSPEMRAANTRAYAKVGVTWQHDR